MPIRCLVRVKTTAYFRDVVRQKHPGIEMAWIQRVIANAFFDRGFLKVRTRSQPSAPAVPPAP